MQRLSVPVDFILAAGLVLLGLGLEYWRPFGMHAADAASLTGALVGAAAILIGNAINRRQERLRHEREEEQQRARVSALVTAELVDVAAGLFDAKRLIDAYWISFVHGGTRRDSLDSPQFRVREMPLSSSLGPDLLLLGRDGVDALATVLAGMRLTDVAISEFKSGAVAVGDIRRLSDMIGATMRNLADAFERVAPERRLLFPGAAEQVLAADALRQRAEAPKDPKIMSPL